jgi:hypothetical protein
MHAVMSICVNAGVGKGGVLHAFMATGRKLYTVWNESSSSFWELGCSKGFHPAWMGGGMGWRPAAAFEKKKERGPHQSSRTCDTLVLENVNDALTCVTGKGGWVQVAAG